MKCSVAEQMIIDHALGFLAEKQERELKHHLAACEQCRTLATSYGLAVQALQTQDIDSQAMLEPTWKTVATAVATEKRMPLQAKLTKAFLPLLAAAAVVLAILFSPVFFSDNKNGEFTRMEVIQAYADDLEYLEFGNETTAATSSGISFQEFGLSTDDASYLFQQ